MIWPGATDTSTAPPHASPWRHSLPPSLAACGRAVLLQPDATSKISLTHAAFDAFTSGGLPVGEDSAPDAPARPALPRLVPLREVPRQPQTQLSLAAFQMHLLAHIELNAVDLAWDTVVRYSHLPMPRKFFADFVRVADDEARHLGWCLQRLHELGTFYGAVDSHNALWEAAEATADDVLDRLVIVPCVQEARGLDAGPRLIERLKGAGDARSAAIVQRISSEEQAHVAVGVAWLHAVASSRGVDPGDAFSSAVRRHIPDGLRGPFDLHTRERVGLPRHWWESSTEARINDQDARKLASRLQTLVAADVAMAGRRVS